MAMQNKEHQKHYISEQKPCWHVCENLGEIFWNGNSVCFVSALFSLVAR